MKFIILTYYLTSTYVYLKYGIVLSYYILQLIQALTVAMVSCRTNAIACPWRSACARLCMLHYFIAVARSR